MGQMSGVANPGMQASQGGNNVVAMPKPAGGSLPPMGANAV
jgi:hypothetical protein